MANRVSVRNPQTMRFVIDSSANVTPVSYTALVDLEIVEIFVILTAAVANTMTIKNGATTVASIVSAGTLGEVDYASALANADITKLYVTSGSAITVGTSDANARAEVFVRVLPGVTATN
jgi:hypothetical protein